MVKIYNKGDKPTKIAPNQSGVAVVNEDYAVTPPISTMVHSLDPGIGVQSLSTMVITLLDPMVGTPPCTLSYTLTP